MLQSFRDWVYNKWQGRFSRGININLASMLIGRYIDKGYIVSASVMTVTSLHTGHWPWSLFEFAFQVGHKPAWHVNVLGLTVGMVRQSNLNEDGTLKGPDIYRLYYMFKGLNHQHKTLQEII